MRWACTSLLALVMGLSSITSASSATLGQLERKAWQLQAQRDGYYGGYGSYGDYGYRDPGYRGGRSGYWDGGQGYGDGRYGGRPDYGRDYRGYRGDDGAALAAGILGFALGAAIAGSANQRAYAETRLGDPDWLAYCSRRYRSFDPASGTYLGYDGYRHYCAS